LENGDWHTVLVFPISPNIISNNERFVQTSADACGKTLELRRRPISWELRLYANALFANFPALEIEERLNLWVCANQVYERK